MRIFPAYWAVLTVAAIVPGMAGIFSGNWWVYYGLLQNYPIYEATGTCAVDPFRCGIPIAWTLSIEVFFYLTLPLFVLAMAWLGERWRGGWLRLELAAVAVISAISILIQGSVPDNDVHTWLFFSPLGRGWWFGLGLALAAISVQLSHRPTEPAFVDWMRRHPGIPVSPVSCCTASPPSSGRPSPSLSYPWSIWATTWRSTSCSASSRR